MCGDGRIYVRMADCVRESERKAEVFVGICME